MNKLPLFATPAARPLTVRTNLRAGALREGAIKLREEASK